MTERFNNFLPFIYRWECVYNRRHEVITENDPDDPGGATRYGIDKRSHPHVDVVHLTEPQAREIYWQEWQACGAENMAPCLGEVFFNACVNCGTGRARKLMSACESADVFLDRQEDFYRRLAESKPKLRKFLKGWLARTKDLRKYLGL